MKTLYTDIDPYCCEVLRARVADGSLRDGDIDCLDIKDLGGDGLRTYQNIHLFAGIGGLPLGLAWAQWPDSWSIVTGGFPCQDVSNAGLGAGLDGKRSGLFYELVRVVDFRRPFFVLAENVGALSSRGLDRVERALGACGYEVSALRMGAWTVGAPHCRERWWIVAKSRSIGRETLALPAPQAHRGQPEPTRTRRAVRHAWPPRPAQVASIPVAVDGLPARMAGRGDAIRATGNSVVPQVVEVVARAVIAHASLPN